MSIFEFGCDGRVRDGTQAKLEKRCRSSSGGMISESFRSMHASARTREGVRDALDRCLLSSPRHPAVHVREKELTSSPTAGPVRQNRPVALEASLGHPGATRGSSASARP